MTVSTEADLAAARRGDEAAFEALLAAYRNPLHAYCYRTLGSVHDADDGLQAGPGRQQAELGDQGRRAFVEAFVAAWEQADVAALVALLADDVRFSMPPLSAWFDGPADVARFFNQRIWTTAGGCSRSRPTASSPSPATTASSPPPAIRGGPQTEPTGHGSSVPSTCSRCAAARWRN